MSGCYSERDLAEAIDFLATKPGVEQMAQKLWDRSREEGRARERLVETERQLMLALEERDVLRIQVNGAIKAAIGSGGSVVPSLADVALTRVEKERNEALAKAESYHGNIKLLTETARRAGCINENPIEWICQVILNVRVSSRRQEARAEPSNAVLDYGAEVGRLLVRREVAAHHGGFLSADEEAQIAETLHDLRHEMSEEDEVVIERTVARLVKLHFQCAHCATQMQSAAAFFVHIKKCAKRPIVNWHGIAARWRELWSGGGKSSA